MEGKVCIKCKGSNFYTYPSGRKACRDCHNQGRKAWYYRHPQIRKDQSRKYGLKRMYGISEEQYNDILEQQNGRCAICGTDDFGLKRPHTDHNHITDKVRGILCSLCNVGLGAFKDSEDTLYKAIEYLKRTR